MPVWLACGVFWKRCEVLRKGCGPERRPDEDNEERHVWLSSEYYSGDENKKNDVGGGACSVCVGEEQCIQNFDGETCRKGTPEKLDVRCGILLKLILIEWV